MICIVMNFRKTWLIANSQKFPKCKHSINIHTISISSQTPHHISWAGKNKNAEKIYLSFKRPVFENLGEFSLIQQPHCSLLLSLQAPYPILGLRVTNLKIAPFLSHRPTCTCMSCCIVRDRLLTPLASKWWNIFTIDNLFYTNTGCYK